MRTVLLASAALSMPVAFASAPPAAGNTGNTTKPRVAPELTATHKIDLPAPTSRRGSESAYNFDSLTEVGMSFGVKNKTALQLASAVANANRKGQVPKLDAAGNQVYGTKELTAADGSKTVVTDTDKPLKVAGKKFRAVDVDASLKKKIAGTPLEGSKSLIVRDA